MMVKCSRDEGELGKGDGKVNSAITQLAHEVKVRGNMIVFSVRGWDWHGSVFCVVSNS